MRANSKAPAEVRRPLRKSLFIALFLLNSGVVLRNQGEAEFIIRPARQLDNRDVAWEKSGEPLAMNR